jgi:hypothetical protein
VLGATPAKLAWPYGQAIDVVVSGKDLGRVRAWVLRGTLPPLKMAEIEKIAASAPDVAEAVLEPIGGNNTDAGREVYSAGSLHAVITGNADGPVTVCVTAIRPATGPLYVCEPLTLRHTLELDYGDGRFASAMTPLLFRLP